MRIISPKVRKGLPSAQSALIRSMSFSCRLRYLFKSRIIMMSHVLMGWKMLMELIIERQAESREQKRVLSLQYKE